MLLRFGDGIPKLNTTKVSCEKIRDITGLPFPILHCHYLDYWESH